MMTQKALKEMMEKARKGMESEKEKRLFNKRCAAIAPDVVRQCKSGIENYHHTGMLHVNVTDALLRQRITYGANGDDPVERASAFEGKEADIYNCLNNVLRDKKNMLKIILFLADKRRDGVQFLYFNISDGIEGRLYKKGDNRFDVRGPFACHRACIMIGKNDDYFDGNDCHPFIVKSAYPVLR